jgi:hypothetical protein
VLAREFHGVVKTVLAVQHMLDISSREQGDGCPLV